MTRKRSVMLPPALTLVLALVSCAVNECGAVCQQHRGLWTPRTECPARDLRELAWQLSVGTRGTSCAVSASHCSGSEAVHTSLTRDCTQQIARLGLGTAICAVKIEEIGLSAVCRANGVVCEYVFEATTDVLACSGARDAGADTD